ncbi:hypothetical protein PA598K_05012 [Paenibacillus sp. 598K]|uniref:4'-phosphopantetheinyl transferase family protein n=1 Tax=Paenibacillus sp. 598K TaxID=1117987 RepID=UPI000FFAF041|nr:4'-phosphopantetheinyl transferase superfamily protein [Paenibacillus sp. 598K]GBF76536.1 hypothetical protein PA598K_05012 [Paenibacillus sp. 598K]
MKLAAVRIEETVDDSRYERLLAQVSAERRAKAGRFKFRRDAVRTAAGELLLQRLLGAADGTLSFRYLSHGKPELIDYPGTWHNISHSGEYVVCVCHEVPVGVDVEAVRPVDDDLAKRCFADAERMYMQATEEETQRLRRFYELWSAKESYIKAVGDGLSMPLQSFVVRIGMDGARLETAAGESLPWEIRLLPLDAGHALAVCASQLPPDIALDVLSLDELLGS